ncbi:DUF4253 domain-containing protein [Streptomyces bobili]|uniref:DUF4253 domain-containing protein n=1 Tax=Streptomyces bobili TaxID=67280 RepID=UPI0036E871C0
MAEFIAPNHEFGGAEVSALATQAGFSVPPDAVAAATNADGIRSRGFIVPRAQAWTVWHRLHELHVSGSGWYPVLSVADPKSLIQSSPEFPPAGREAVAAAVARNPDEVIAEMVSAFLVDSLDKSPDKETEQEWLETLNPRTLADSLMGPIDAPLPGDPWEGFLSCESELWMCLVEALHGYEIPVLLQTLPHTPNWYVDKVQRGLEPADHLAFLRSWQRRFGAELFYIDGSNLRLAVSRPPLTPLAAAQAAVERFSYSSDGAPDLPVLGDGEIRSTVWTCWWD